MIVFKKNAIDADVIDICHVSDAGVYSVWGQLHYDALNEGGEINTDLIFINNGEVAVKFTHDDRPIPEAVKK